MGSRVLNRRFHWRKVEKPGGVVVEDASDRRVPEDAGKFGWFVEIPVRKIARIHDGVVGVDHVENLLQMFGMRRLFNGLSGQADVVAHVFARHALEERRLLAEGLELGVHAPQQVRQPCDAAFDKHHPQAGEFLEHAVEHHARRLRHVELRQANVRFQIGRRLPGGRHRGIRNDSTG